MGGYYIFDLPALTDANSVLLPKNMTFPKNNNQEEDLNASTNSDKRGDSPTCEKAESEKMTRITVVLATPQQIDRLPQQWSLDFRNKPSTVATPSSFSPKFDKVETFHSMVDFITTPRCSVDTNLVPADIPIMEDSPIFVNLVENVEQVTPLTKSLLESENWTMHTAAQKCLPLFDVRNDGRPLADYTTLRTGRFKEFSQYPGNVLTSTQRVMTATSVESAHCENPLLNTFLTAAKANGAVVFSPHWLRMVIDQQLFRIQNASPLSQVSANENASPIMATLCVEDTTSSTSVRQRMHDASEDTPLTHWKDPSYYYGKTAGVLSSIITQKLFPKKENNTPTHRSEFETALCSLPLTRVTSLLETGAGVTAIKGSYIDPWFAYNYATSSFFETFASSPSNTSFSASSSSASSPSNTSSSASSSSEMTFSSSETLPICPNCEKRDWYDETMFQSVKNSIVAGEKTLADKSKTLEPTTRMLCNLQHLRQHVTDENASMFFQFARSNYSIDTAPPKGVQSLKRIVCAGHHTEWRYLLDRLKQQIQKSREPVTDWLVAMYWFTIQLCSIRDSNEERKIVQKKDILFLRLFVGDDWVHIFHPKDGNYNAQMFMERLFWYNLEDDRVGGLAMLFFPLETAQLIRVENVRASETERKLRPFLNGPLLRVVHTLISIGAGVKTLMDFRNTTMYQVMTSRFEIDRRIVSGVAGYLVHDVSQKFNFSCAALQPVFACFDSVKRITFNDLIVPMPAVVVPQSEVVATSLDESLEKFSTFPQREDQGFDTQYKSVKTEQRRFDSETSHAGLNERQVVYGRSAESYDANVFINQFHSQLDYFEKSRTDEPANSGNKTDEMPELVEQRPSTPPVVYIQPMPILGDVKQDLVINFSNLIQQLDNVPDIAAAVTTVAPIVTEPVAPVAPIVTEPIAPVAPIFTEPVARDPSIDKLRAEKQLKREKARLAAELNREKAKLAAELNRAKQLAQNAERKKKKPLLANPPRQASVIQRVAKVATLPVVQVIPQSVNAVQPVNTTQPVAAPVASQPVITTQPVNAVASQPVNDDQPVAVSVASQPVNAVQPVNASLPVVQVAAQPVNASLSVNVEPKALPASVFTSQVFSKDDKIAEPPAVDPQVSDFIATVVILPSIVAPTTITPATITPSTIVPKKEKYVLPSDWSIDVAKMNQQLQALSTPVQFARLWIQLANAERAFSHVHHVPFTARAPLPEGVMDQHVIFNVAKNNSPTILSAFGLILLAIDNIFACYDSTSTDVVSSLIGQGALQDTIHPLGRRIMTEVVHRACLQSHGDASVDIGSANCCICRKRYHSRFYLVPQFVDVNHTVATRLLPICDDEACVSRAIYNFSHRKPNGACATLSGLRVFFYIDGSIAVFESENDPYKLVLGSSKSAFVNSDFIMDQGPPTMLMDNVGNMFALPSRVALKANLLAASLMASI